MTGSTPVVAPDITGTIPGAIVPLGQATTLTPAGVRFDVAIAGVPFMLAANPQLAYVRQTASIEKPQFDVSEQAGEQTLDQYWIRSQTSWHRGAGVRFYEPGLSIRTGYLFDPGSDILSTQRFDSSAGVDINVRDEATLLKAMSLTGASGGLAFATTGKLTDGTDVVFTNEAGTIKRRTAAGTSTSYTGGTSPLTAVAVAGSKILVGHGSGIDVGDASGTTLAALWTIAAGATVVPYWCKERIIASIGPSLYSLTVAGGAIVAGDIIHTHADPSWVWTDVTDGPAAIYAAGYGGAVSSIYKFALIAASSGTLPILDQAYEIATMPTGEQVTSMKTYLGTYVGIGTSKGVRVALIDSTGGGINYGPLSVETTNPVLSLEGNDSYIYAATTAAIDGNSGAYRINLGEILPHETLRFAYASDAQTHDTGTVCSIAFFGTTERVVLGVVGKGIYTQSATVYEPSGYILSGRMRYNTVENKVFRQADMRVSLTAGTVNLSAVDEHGSEVSIATLNAANLDGTALGLQGIAGFHEYLQFRTTLTRGVSTTDTPTLNSLQIKALPAPKRQRMVQYPLNCVDNETDALGVPVGHLGWAWERLQALESAEENNVIMQVQDYTNGETYNATVFQQEFTRTVTRSRGGLGNFGGILKVTMKKL